MSAPSPNDRVLSTLNVDGSRFWLRPRLVKGGFWRARAVVAYALIALFVVLPWININGRPALLFDLVTREFSMFGMLFRPSDGFMLMLLGLTIVLTVFLVTALFGRVWCGWGCPQTVYMEFVFRPIERLFEGKRSSGDLEKNPISGARKAGKYAIYVLLSFLLANVFLSYFVGVERLLRWVTTSPAVHPIGFLTVVGVTGLMFFDFAYFREQTCIVACPYGRLQSVMLDRQSLIVGYDVGRGEPRGANKKKKLPVVQDEPRGDCIDCGACVAVCPTGIDIRNGLQMECIGCAQCIDACAPVMAKLGRPDGLIRYTSGDELSGKPRKVLRVRTVVYPVLLAVVFGLLVLFINKKPGSEVWVTRIVGPAFVDLPDGRVSSQMRIKIENQRDQAHRYTFALVNGSVGELRSPQPEWTLAPKKSLEVPLFVDVARNQFVNGEIGVTVKVADDTGWSRDVRVTLLGPALATE